MGLYDYGDDEGFLTDSFSDDPYGPVAEYYQGPITAPTVTAQQAATQQGGFDLGQTLGSLFNTTLATAATAGSAALTSQLSSLIYGDREAIERQQTSAAANTLAQQQAAKAAQTKNWLMIGGIGVALILVFGVVLKFFK